MQKARSLSARAVVRPSAQFDITPRERQPRLVSEVHAALGFPRGVIHGGEDWNVTDIKVGDLVSWASNEKTRVGVVSVVHEDGSCTIDLTTQAGRFEQRISGARLHRITSTTEPQSKEE